MFLLNVGWSVTTPGDAEAFDDQQMEEAQVMQRVKERVNKVLAARLAGTFMVLSHVLRVSCVVRVF